MIVTIDGPAGTGKSTVARGLAERLGFAYLDTGAMYRAVALACLEFHVDVGDDATTADLARRLTLELDGPRVWLDGREVTSRIRDPDVTGAASLVARNPGVRGHLVELQRTLASGKDVVCEGRDQGTVVFPEASWKFFLTADPGERARRRQQELTAKGEEISLAELARQLRERDERDARRDVAPLSPAEDAVIVDTTHLDSQEVIQYLLDAMRGACSRPTGQNGGKGATSP